ncbi:MAG: hypothetical protein Q4D51_10770, partial [Eubacteriales bacterium]|nr:hypothetical protein [Eubacteriales bacterium]
MTRKKLFSMTLALAMTASLFTTMPKSNAATQKTFVVSATGDYSGVSNANATYKSLQEAINAGKDANIIANIIVKGGSYTEGVNLSDASNLTIKGYENEKVMLTGTVKGADDYINFVEMKGSHNITLDNLYIGGYTVTTKGTTVTAINVNGNSSDITIQNCDISNIVIDYKAAGAKKNSNHNAHGIIVRGNTATPISNINVLNNTVHDLKLGQSESVVFNGNVDGFNVSHNTIYNCDNIGIDMIGYEETYEADQTKNRARNGICTYNYVHDISTKTNVTYGTNDCCAGGI